MIVWPIVPPGIGDRIQEEFNCKSGLLCWEVAAAKLNRGAGSRERVYTLARKIADHIMGQRVHSKSEPNLFNLESLFTTFEIAATLGHLPDLTKDEISKLVEALQTVIVFTLDYSMRFPVSPREGFIPSGAYRRLSDMMDRATFTKRLDEIREIRNDLMHFHPDGISGDDAETLRETARFFYSFSQFRHAN